MREKSLDIHQTVTDQIVAAIESGVGEWSMPWHRSGSTSFIPKNVEGHSYNGINILSLWATAQNRGYEHPLWATYRQWQEAGGQVRKGEKAALVVFYKQFSTEPDPEQDHDDGIRRVAKASWVFNVAQQDGFALPAPSPPAPPFERLARVEEVFAATGATILIGGSEACYNRVTDCIHMPDAHRFLGDEFQRREAFYGTLAHEAVHWAGAPHRLNREKGKTFGDAVYAGEELIAELGASMLCADLQISPVVRKEHAEYIAHWLRAMKEDKKAIFRAAARASEAVKFITSFSEASHAKAA